MRDPLRVVVVAYHGSGQLDRCLEALAQTVSVILVDNSSSTAVQAVALRHGAEYVDPGVNLGFGGGVNVALRSILAGEPTDVLLLNPDAVVSPADLDRLSAELRRPSGGRVGAVSPRILGEDGVEERVVWPFPTPWRGWLDALGLGRLPTRDTFVIGAVVLLCWEAIDDVGLFDERFFLYAEEADWQRRAREAGWRSVLCNSAVATHQGGGTSSSELKREALFHAGQETYIRKWYGAPGWIVYRTAAILGASCRLLILRGDRRRQAGRRALLYVRGPRRCAGFEAVP